MLFFSFFDAICDIHWSVSDKWRTDFLASGSRDVSRGSVISLKSKQQLHFRKIIRNLGTGSTWVIANTSLFAVSSSLGVGVTYSFSQMSLLVATYGSIVLLKEQKVGREKQFVVLGSLLYIVGVLGMSWLK